MKSGLRKFVAGATALAFALVVALAIATPAAAAKAKSVQTEAKWISYDAEAKTVTVKVRKTGKKPKDEALKLRKGKEATFTIREGSVMTRTGVSINGKGGKLTDIPAGKTVNVYWQPDENNPGQRWAKKIDLILSEEELLERSTAD